MTSSARPVLLSRSLLALALASGCSSAPAPGGPGSKGSPVGSSGDSPGPGLDASTRGDADTQGHDAAAASDAEPLDDASRTDATDAGASQDAALGDAGAYQPCPPAGTPCAIMPLGDSITDGTAGSSIGGGYRGSPFD